MIIGNSRREGKTIALLVNGERIEDSVIEAEFERLRPDYERFFKDQSPAQQAEQLFKWSRENVIERVLIQQHARDNITKIPQKDVEATLTRTKKQYRQQGKELATQEQKKLKEDIELKMKVERLMEEACKDAGQPAEEDIKKYYEENKQRLKTDERVRVCHIVKHINWQTDEAEAHRIIAEAQQKLKEGVAFELLVPKYSDCHDNGGDLGYIATGQMVEEFEDVVFNLGSGQISDVFRTRLGYHIAKLYDRKEAASQSFEEVKEQIVKTLKEQMQTEALERFIDRLKEKAEIKDV